MRCGSRRSRWATSLAAPMRARQPRAKRRNLMLERSVASLELFDSLTQRLDCGQRNPVTVHLQDRLVVRSDVERRHEVLRHRADVASFRAVVLVAPAGDRESVDSLQNFVIVYRREVALHVAIADRHLATAGADEGAALAAAGARRAIEEASLCSALSTRSSGSTRAARTSGGAAASVSAAAPTTMAGRSPG